MQSASVKFLPQLRFRTCHVCRNSNALESCNVSSLSAATNHFDCLNSARCAVLLCHLPLDNFECSLQIARADPIRPPVYFDRRVYELFGETISCTCRSTSRAERGIAKGGVMLIFARKHAERPDKHRIKFGTLGSARRARSEIENGRISD